MEADDGGDWVGVGRSRGDIMLVVGEFLEGLKRALAGRARICALHVFLEIEGQRQIERREKSALPPSEFPNNIKPPSSPRLPLVQILYLARIALGPQLTSDLLRRVLSSYVGFVAGYVSFMILELLERRRHC